MNPITTASETDPHLIEDRIQPFENREEAGRELAKRLTKFTGSRDTVVLAFPSGGVAVGAEITRILRIPFDIFLVGKITTPGCRDSSLGAITSNGVRTLNNAMIDRLHLSDAEIRSAVLRKSLQLARREKFYRGHHPSLMVADHTVILVDDGSTPYTALQNAIRLLRRQHAERIIVTLPSACRLAACDLRMETDDVVTLMEPKSTITAAKCYRHFPRTSAKDVRRLLDREHAGLIDNNQGFLAS